MSLKQSSIPAVVFDFGGVLFDWNPRHLYRQLFTDRLEEMELFLTEIKFAEWNVQQDRGRPFAEAVAELCAQFPHHADLIKAYDERWEESIGGVIRPTVDILHRLKRAGCPLYGLSNWSAETFRRIRHKHDFLNLFDDIIISGEVGMIKPDPDIFMILLERAKRSAEECVFIDDSEANVVAAAKLGFQSIRFESARQLEAELSRLGL